MSERLLVLAVAAWGFWSRLLMSIVYDANENKIVEPLRDTALLFVQAISGGIRDGLEEGKSIEVNSGVGSSYKRL